MNSSTISDSHNAPKECGIHIFLGGTLDHTATEAYAVLVFLIIVNIITCPVTIILNTLALLAVNTKPRLKTKSNVALGCLATTDGIMGLIGQPLFIAWITSSLHGQNSSAYCTLQSLSRNSLRVLIAESLFQLVLINVERYIAIKHSLEYITMVTKTRILRSSALAWIAVLFLTITCTIIDNDIYLTVSNILVCVCVAIIIFCQVVLYIETRRHEKEIASQ